jgi:hypothetical protein
MVMWLDVLALPAELPAVLAPSGSAPTVHCGIARDRLCSGQ